LIAWEPGESEKKELRYRGREGGEKRGRPAGVLIVKRKDSPGKALYSTMCIGETTSKYPWCELQLVTSPAHARPQSVPPRRRQWL
jgi:hypothetical protein